MPEEPGVSNNNGRRWEAGEEKGKCLCEIADDEGDRSGLVGDRAGWKGATIHSVDSDRLS